MIEDKPALIIPVENQVRELDPKLLLASVVARRAVMDEYLEARDGPLASERIISVIDAAIAEGAGPSRPALADRARGWYHAT